MLIQQVGKINQCQFNRVEKSTNANSTGWKNQPMLIQQGGKINPNPRKRKRFNLYRITGLTLRSRKS